METDCSICGHAEDDHSDGLVTSRLVKGCICVYYKAPEEEEE